MTTTSGGRPGWLSQLRPDPYVLALLACVVTASILPARGVAADGLGVAAKLVVALLFFLHGAKLPPQAVIAGVTHWRLHLTILAVTFVAFPLLGLAIVALTGAALPAQLGLGVLFLCCLPSTVQSSIAFTSIARGNVPAAVASASASNVLGMAVTPLLVGLLMHAKAGFSLDALWSVAGQLLAPFIIGQCLRPFIKGWIEKTRKLLGLVDRGSVLFVVYSAFSAAVVQGIWSRVSLGDLLITGLVAALLLALVIVGTGRLAKGLGFAPEDQIVVQFCGSKKSLVTGAPMAAILFAPAAAGVIILPLMLYHQMQMMVCAVLAQRYAARPKTVMEIAA